MSFTKATKYGTGIGYIYLTTFNDNIVASYRNNKSGKEMADKIILASAPVIGETLASCTITFTAGAGTVTNLTVNGVSIFDTETPITGASLSALATNTAIAINSFTSSPNYSAQTIGDTVYVFIQSGLGSSLNGSTVSTTVTGTLEYTKTDLDGGTSSQDVIDAQTGIKIWINDHVSAQPGTLVGATDVTQFIVRKPYNSPLDIREYVIAGGSINLVRKGTLTEILVDTEGLSASDNLDNIIAVGFSNGDSVILRGKNASRIVTLTNSGNLNLSNNNNFLTGDNNNVIQLQFINGDFYELFRSPSIPLTVSAFRSASFPQGELGDTVIALTAGGGTINLEPGVATKYIKISGSPVTLSSSWTIQGTGTPIDGDEFVVYFDQEVTLNGNNVTVFGISLTSEQALVTATSGKKPVIIGQYVDGSWRGTLILNSRGRDLVDTTQLATKENVLGNPLVSGYILSSSDAGVRSWIPQGQIYDSGWKVIPNYNSTYGIAPLTGWTNPSVRVVGRVLYMNGLFMIPLADGSGNLLPAANNYQTNNTTVKTYEGANGGFLLNGFGGLTSMSPLLPEELRPNKDVDTTLFTDCARNILAADNASIICLSSLLVRIRLTTAGKLTMSTNADLDDSSGIALNNTSRHLMITKADSGANVPSYSTYKQQVGGFAVTDSGETYPVAVNGEDETKLGGYYFVLNLSYPINSSFTEDQIRAAFDAL
jgi:hypothetical protein